MEWPNYLTRPLLATFIPQIFPICFLLRFSLNFSPFLSLFICSLSFISELFHNLKHVYVDRQELVSKTNIPASQLLFWKSNFSLRELHFSPLHTSDIFTLSFYLFANFFNHSPPNHRPAPKMTHLISLWVRGEGVSSFSYPFSSLHTYKQNMYLKYCEISLEVFVQFQDGRHIPTPNSGKGNISRHRAAKQQLKTRKV